MASLLERAERDGTPIVEGDTVTFVWQGDAAPRLLGDFNLWGHADTSSEMQESAPGVWIRDLALPRDAYIEYVFDTVRGLVLDPFNGRAIEDGLGGSHSFFGMPEFVDTPLISASAHLPRGTVAPHQAFDTAHVVGGTRTVHLYRPPVPGLSPLLVVWDGQDYLRRAMLPTIVDNLIAQGRIRPISMAMIEHGAAARPVEYNCNDATVNFLTRSVVPLARDHLDLMDESQEPWGILGASGGGLMALYTAMRRPDLFSRVLAQSGDFGIHAGSRIIEDMVRYFPPRPLAIWMEVGCFEALLGANRRMRALLLQLGYTVSYREYHGGHNYTSWRVGVVSGLERMFPPR